MSKTKIYYAHSMSIYSSPEKENKQEKRDIAMLEAIGFEVFNPNQPWIQEKCKELGANSMSLFESMVKEDTQALAFRAHPDGTIGAGIVKEIAWAKEVDHPVIELPSSITRRSLSVDDTREYLKELGQR